MYSLLAEHNILFHFILLFTKVWQYLNTGLASCKWLVGFWTYYVNNYNIADTMKIKWKQLPAIFYLLVQYNKVYKSQDWVPTDDTSSLIPIYLLGQRVLYLEGIIRGLVKIIQLESISYAKKLMDRGKLKRVTTDRHLGQTIRITSQNVCFIS